MYDSTRRTDADARVSDREVDSTSRFFEALASRRRRTLLAVLLDEGGPVCERRLTARVAASERDDPADVPSQACRDDVRTTFHHAHLPKLQETGLIEHDRDEGTVAAADDVVIDLAEVEALLDDGNGIQPARVTETMSILASCRRRTILSLLSRRSTMTREEVAEYVASRERDGPPAPEDVERVLVDLHHVHVPKLAEAEMIETGEDGRELVYRDDPLLDDHGLLALTPEAP